MGFLFALLAVAIMVIGFASSAPEGVTDLAIRADPAPAGCSASYDGPFQASIAELDKADASPLKKRAVCGSGSQLMVTLKDGILTDAAGRTGYIASNYQFQFDAPPQHGSLVDSGFSVCQNGSLGLGKSTIFYQCASGSFSNLYDRLWADHCSPVNLQVTPCSDIEDSSEAPVGKVVGTEMVQTTLVTVLQDGQPQVVATEVPIPICQIGDGQIQGHTTPCAELPAPTPSGQLIPPSPPAPTPTTPATTMASPESSVESTPTPTPAAGAGRSSGSTLLALVICMAAAVL